MKRLFALLLCSASLFACGSDSDTGDDLYDLYIQNDMDFDVYEMFVSPSSSSDWGPDQLGATVLEPGDDFTLLALPCGEYDLRIVDENGDECVTADSEFICESDAAFFISSETFPDC